MASQNPTATKIDKDEKICFVISPIGDEGSSIRNYADFVFEFIIRPAVERYSFNPVRADHMPEPGIITSGIIDHLINDPLIIADLTGSNPNVTYELAIRHAVKKHPIQIKDFHGSIPFDVRSMSTIHFNFGDAKSMLKCRDDLSKQIGFIEKYPDKVESPITQAVIAHALEPSKDPMMEYIQQLKSQIQTLNSKIDNMEAKQPFHPRIIQSEASPLSGQAIIDWSNIKFDPSPKVVFQPDFSNLRPTVGEPTFWGITEKKKSEPKEETDK